MKFKGLLLLMAALLLSGCSMFAAPTAQPLPTVVLDAKNSAGTPAPSLGGGVTASGVVAPAQQAQLASGLGGMIKSVAANEGQHVSAGQVLVTLAGGERLSAAVTAASLELLSAQQALKTLTDGLDSARAAAQLRLANAQKALDDAQKNRYSADYRYGSSADIASAQADLVIANDAVKKAQDAYDPLADKPESDVNRANALNRLIAAQKHRDQVVANLNALLATPDAIDVNQAQAELVAAQAEADAAQLAVDKLKNGPDPDAVALAQARIQNAQAQLSASQAALADLQIVAPFAGTLTRVNFHPGEWVAPGQVVLVLADLEALRVETTDLSERDVPRLSPGQPATVTVKALGQSISGKLESIAQVATTLGGDVVYKTIVTLDSPPAALRVGMTVDVTFRSSQ